MDTKAADILKRELLKNVHKQKYTHTKTTFIPVDFNFAKEVKVNRQQI